jgi:hypothetical protein
MFLRVYAIFSKTKWGTRKENGGNQEIKYKKALQK